MYNYDTSQQSDNQAFTNQVLQMLRDDPSTGSNPAPSSPPIKFNDNLTPEQKRRHALLSFMANQAPKFNAGFDMAMQNNPQSLQALGGRPMQQAPYMGQQIPQNAPSPLMFQIQKLLQGLRGQP